MNQNLYNFTSAILKRRSVKRRNLSENYAKIVLSEPRKGVKKLKVRSQPMASQKRFQSDRALKGENGTEILLCDVIVVLNIAAFLHQWVVRGEGFGSK